MALSDLPTRRNRRRPAASSARSAATQAASSAEYIRASHPAQRALRSGLACAVGVCWPDGEISLRWPIRAWAPCDGKSGRVEVAVSSIERYRERIRRVRLARDIWYGGGTGLHRRCGGDFRLRNAYLRASRLTAAGRTRGIPGMDAITPEDDANKVRCRNCRRMSARRRYPEQGYATKRDAPAVAETRAGHPRLPCRRVKPRPDKPAQHVRASLLDGS